MEIDHGEQHLIERVAAIDIGNAEMVCCVRVPGAGRARAQEVRTYSTMTPNVLEMTDWLTGLGVTRVVMEATSDYWNLPLRPVHQWSGPIAWIDPLHGTRGAHQGCPHHRAHYGVQPRQDARDLPRQKPSTPRAGDSHSARDFEGTRAPSAFGCRTAEGVAILTRAGLVRRNQWRCNR